MLVNIAECPCVSISGFADVEGALKAAGIKWVSLMGINVCIIDMKSVEELDIPRAANWYHSKSHAWV